MTRTPEVERKVQDHVNKVCQYFGFYVDVFNTRGPFRKPEQLNSHRKTIGLRDKLGSISAALASDAFLDSLRKTAEAWGMAGRGAKLVDALTFRQRLRNQREALLQLEDLHIDAPDFPAHKTAATLWSIIKGIELSRTGSQLVTGSKALHHILPDLVPPIDRGYTRRFFCFWSQYFQNNPDKVLLDIFPRFTEIARRTNPGQWVTKKGWMTSKTKILDNALVGFCIHHKLPKL